jgi:hypothetical protein
VTIRVKSNLHLGGLLPGHVSREALDDAAQHVLEVARGKAPLLVDTQRANKEEVPGTLRDSGYADVVDDVTARVGFRDGIAGRMHEDMGLHHDDGQPKFLEEPMVSEKDEVLRILADRIRAGLSE